MLKKNYRKIGKKNDNDVDADVAQLEWSNNKCYALAFRYIYIYIYIDYLQPFKHPISQLVNLFDYEWSNKNGGSI